MKIIQKFYIKGQQIGRKGFVSLVADSRHMISFAFEFDEMWEGLSKTALIKTGGEVHEALIEADGTIADQNMPVLKAGESSVSVIGGSLYTTAEYKFNVAESGSMGFPDFVPMDIYSQILNKATASLEKSEQALELASDSQNAAVVNAQLAVQAAQKAQQAAESIDAEQIQESARDITGLQEFVYPVNISKNLLKFPNVDNQTINGVTYSIRDNILVLSGTPEKAFNLTVPVSGLKTGRDYYLNVGIDTSHFVNVSSGFGDEEIRDFKTFFIGNSRNALMNFAFAPALIYLYLKPGTVFNGVSYTFTLTDKPSDAMYVNPYIYAVAPELDKNIRQCTFENNKWYGKNVLALGDSLTAAKQWQKKLETILGMKADTHALGGAGITQIVDGMKNVNGTLQPLTADKVRGKDLIIFFGGINNLSDPHGTEGDLYPETPTVAGKLQYAIDKIFSLLAQADNLSCPVALITPYCYGASPYNPNALESNGMGLAKIMEGVAGVNGLPCWNAYKNSGINKYTWGIYSANSTATDSEGNILDQLHLNTSAGYPHLGEGIAGFIQSI